MYYLLSAEAAAALCRNEPFDVTCTFDNITQLPPTAGSPIRSGDWKLQSVFHNGEFVYVA